MFPKLLQRLFANEGAGPKLRADILPLDNKTLTVNGESAVAVQMSDAVNSAVSTTAASSKAVKTAYDKANSAATAANAAQSAATAAKTAADTAQDTADAAKTAAAAAQTKANSAYTEATKAASTSAAGRVQLSDAVNSAVSTTAATSKAVKTAYDKASGAATAAAAAQADADTAQSTATAAKSAAATAQTKANNAYTEATKAASTSAAGRVQLSDAVNSTASTTAATSKAAKTAYDKAVAATFPKGTKLLFHQAAAPTGWTKQTTVNDAALRVVSGTTGGGTGGSLAFSSLFAAGKAVTLSGNVGATTLTVSQSALHQHATCQGKPFGSSEGFPTGENPNPNKKGLGGTWYGAEEVIYTWASSDAGGSQSHTHTLSGKATIDLNVKYTDVIICAKA